MSLELFTNTIKRYGELIGLGKLTAGDNHTISLRFDSNINVTLQWRSDTNCLYIYTLFARLPPDNPAECLRDLLCANYFWAETSGATVSLDKTSNSLYLADKWGSDCLASVDTFSRQLDQFVDTTEYVQKSIKKNVRTLSPRSNHQHEQLIYQRLTGG